MNSDEINDMICELLWKELVQFESKNDLVGRQLELCEFIRDFSIRHRLCKADVETAMNTLSRESREFPDGRILINTPDKTEIPAGDLYENLKNAGALGCSNSAILL